MRVVLDERTNMTTIGYNNENVQSKKTYTVHPIDTKHITRFLIEGNPVEHVMSMVHFSTEDKEEYVCFYLGSDALNQDVVKPNIILCTENNTTLTPIAFKNLRIHNAKDISRIELRGNQYVLYKKENEDNSDTINIDFLEDNILFGQPWCPFASISIRVYYKNKIFHHSNNGFPRLSYIPMFISMSNYDLISGESNSIFISKFSDDIEKDKCLLYQNGNLSTENYRESVEINITLKGRYILNEQPLVNENLIEILIYSNRVSELMRGTPREYLGKDLEEIIGNISSYTFTIKSEYEDAFKNYVLSIDPNSKISMCTHPYYYTEEQEKKIQELSDKNVEYQYDMYRFLIGELETPPEKYVV